MASTHFKCTDVIVTGNDDNFEVTAIKHCSSPLYVNIAKALLVERVSRSFPGLSFCIKVVNVYE